MHDTCKKSSKWMTIIAIVLAVALVIALIAVIWYRYCKDKDCSWCSGSSGGCEDDCKTTTTCAEKCADSSGTSTSVWVWVGVGIAGLVILAGVIWLIVWSVKRHKHKKAHCVEAPAPCPPAPCAPEPCATMPAPCATKGEAAIHAGKCADACPCPRRVWE